MVENNVYKDDEFLADLQEMIEYYAPARGMNPDAASSLARAVGRMVQQKYAGSPLYIKKAAAVARRELASKVCAAFDGNNHREVIERFGISRATFYRYIGGQDK